MKIYYFPPQSGSRSPTDIPFRAKNKSTNFYTSLPMKNKFVVLFLLSGLFPIFSATFGWSASWGATAGLSHGVTPKNSDDIRFTTLKDTVVFNPSSFYMEPGTNLNELLQHIPGIRLNDHQLYWHEKTLTINIDGKEIFGGSGITGLISISQIKEILIYNSISDLTDLSHNDDQEEDFILNIVLYPTFKDKWYGNIKAGYQTPHQYEVGINARNLNSDHPFMAFFNANTLNKQTSPEQILNPTSEIGQYGRQQYGALSFQHNWTSDRRGQSLSNKYFLNTSAGHSDNWGESDLYQEVFFMDGSKNFTLSCNDHYTHLISPTLSGEVKWKLDEASSLKLQGEMSYSRNETWNDIQEVQTTTEPFTVSSTPLQSAFCKNADSLFHHQLLNRNLSHNHSWEDIVTFHTMAKWERLLTQKSHLNVSASFQYTNIIQKYNSNYHIDKIQQTCTDLAQKYNENPSHRYNGNIIVFYKQWITNQLMFSLNYGFTKIHLFEKQKHYHSPTKDIPHHELIQHLDLTNTFKHQYDNSSHLLTGSFVYNLYNVSIMPSLTWIYADEKAHHLRTYIDTTVYRHKPIWKPTLKIEWQISPLLQTFFEYGYSTFRPGLQNIISWVDNTNPIYKVEGNKDLRSCNMHSGSWYFRGTFPGSQSILSAMITFRHISSPITRAFAYDKQTNTFTTRPQNALRATNRIKWYVDYQQYLSRGWQLKAVLNYYMENRDGFLTTPSFSLLPQSNRQHIAETTLSPQISYEEHPHFKCTMYGDLIFTRNQYRGYNRKFKHLRQYNYGLKVEKYFGNLQLRTDIHDLIYKGYINQRINGHHLLWSASAAWFCLKGKGKLQLECDDLLNNTLLYGRTIEPHSHTEVYENKLHNFVNITFTYHFQP